MSTIQSNTSAPTNPTEGRSHARRDLFLGLGAFILFVVISFGVVTLLNPSSAAPRLPKALQGPPGQAPIDLKIVHTNDTWGYTEPCG